MTVSDLSNAYSYSSLSPAHVACEHVLGEEGARGLLADCDKEERIRRICRSYRLVDDWLLDKLNGPAIVNVVSAYDISLLDSRLLQPVHAASGHSSWRTPSAPSSSPYLSPFSSTRTVIDRDVLDPDPAIWVFGSDVATLAVGAIRQAITIGVPSKARADGVRLDRFDPVVTQWIASAPRHVVLDIVEEEDAMSSDRGVMALSNELALMARGGVRVERRVVPRALTLLAVDELQDLAFDAATALDAFSSAPTSRIRHQVRDEADQR